MLHQLQTQQQTNSDRETNPSSLIKKDSISSSSCTNKEIDLNNYYYKIENILKSRQNFQNERNLNDFKINLNIAPLMQELPQQQNQHVINSPQIIKPYSSTSNIYNISLINTKDLLTLNSSIYNTNKNQTQDKYRISYEQQYKPKLNPSFKYKQNYSILNRTANKKSDDNISENLPLNEYNEKNLFNNQQVKAKTRSTSVPLKNSLTTKPIKSTSNPLPPIKKPLVSNRSLKRVSFDTKNSVNFFEKSIEGVSNNDEDENNDLGEETCQEEDIVLGGELLMASDDEDDDDTTSSKSFHQCQSTKSGDTEDTMTELDDDDTSSSYMDTLSSKDDLTSDGAESLPEKLNKFGFSYKNLFNATTRNENGTLVKYKPPLHTSLFLNVPPTINFITQDEKLNEMPEYLRKILKWKMSSITPNVVKATLARSGFRVTNHKNDWLGTWGRHMKPECFKSLKIYQKFNHLPGSFQIGRKDRLCRNLYHAQAVHGKNEYNFVPVTYVLPFDYNQLKNEMENPSNKNTKWIMKPCASARGQGIRLVSKLEQVSKKKPCVVQKYLSNPYLINGLKFDLRIYVYIPSFDPLKIYIFKDGLTRFASRKYSNSNKTISDRYMHLTNFSVNKNNSEYKSNDDENSCVGHKWSLKALWTYLQKQGVNTDKVWNNIKELVIKTIIVADPHVNVLVKGHVKRKYSVHELFGFDVFLDENLKPWIVEVNISPSLHSSSPLDISVKGQMIADLFNIAGHVLPNHKDMSDKKKPDKNKIPKFLMQDKRIMPQTLSNDEKAKHQFYISRVNDEKIRKTICDVLTPDDLRVLIEFEDELARCGQFSCIFPSHDSIKYLKLFETTRYYNILLHEWLCKYHLNKDKRISIINQYCKKRIHMEHSTNSIENQWLKNSNPMKFGSYTENNATNNGAFSAKLLRTPLSYHTDNQRLSDNED